MVVSHAPLGYTLAVTPAEREQLLVCLEAALSLLRGDGGARGLLLDADRPTVDALADRLFLIGGGR